MALLDIAFVGATGDFADNITDLDLTVPAATVAGDLVVACATCNATGTIATPTGFTLVEASVDGSQITYVWTKVADGTETTVTVTRSVSGKFTASLVVYGNVDQATPIRASVTQDSPGSANSWDLPDLPYTGDGTGLVRVDVPGQRSSTPATDWTVPAPMVSRDERFNAGGGASYHVVADSIGTDLGASPVAGLTYSNNGSVTGAYAGVSLLLSPATAAAPAGPTFSEWDGATEIPLTVAEWDGTSENPLTVEFSQAGEALTLFGASAVSTGLSGQQDVVTKWGSGAAARQFFTSFSEVAPRDPDVSIVHCSWKPASVAAITEAAVTTATANLLPGDCVEVWHEGDKKVRDGVFDHAECLARKNAFYAVVKTVRPDLLVVNTLTGWEADEDNPATLGNIDQWAEVDADLLGLDCDGIHGWPYPVFDDEITTALAFLPNFPAYQGWCVPEFGTSRDATNDVDGSVRATWATDHANQFIAAGAHYVCLYEFESTEGNEFTTSAEIAAWSAYTDPA